MAEKIGFSKTRLYSTESGAAITTDINVNVGYFGGTIFAVESSHSSGGNSTASEFKMIRCGYSENHIEENTIASLVANANSGMNLATYSVSTDGYLVINPKARILKVLLFML